MTIDGTAYSGKSTVATILAKRLGWRMLNTGAMYRTIAWKAIKKGYIKRSSIESIVNMIRNTELKLEENLVLCDGFDITKEIRKSEIDQPLRLIADSPECRVELVKIQRKFASFGDLITEGRDQGSVVFPDARFKFYFDASIDERAHRRHKQDGGDLSKVRQMIIDRDTADMNRIVSPLIKPIGAMVIDTTNINIDQIVNVMEAIIRGASVTC